MFLPTPAFVPTVPSAWCGPTPFSPDGALLLSVLSRAQASVAVRFPCLHAPCSMLLLALCCCSWIPPASRVSLSFVLTAEYAVITRPMCPQDRGSPKAGTSLHCIFSSSPAPEDRVHTDGPFHGSSHLSTQPQSMHCPPCSLLPCKNIRTLSANLISQFHIHDSLCS